MSEPNDYASREDLLAMNGHRRVRDVWLPISERRVRIQSLSDRELSAYQMAAYRPGGKQIDMNRLEDAERRLAVLCLVDGNGSRLLTDDDAAEVVEWDVVDTAVLHAACKDHSGIDRADIEALAKNSGPIPAA